MNDKTKILFVCLGNICRSPAAEGILRTMAARQGIARKIEIDSAGTYGGHAGSLPDPRMRHAAAQRGYDLTHRARQVREADFDRFDMLIAMDDMNYEALHRQDLVRSRMLNHEGEQYKHENLHQKAKFVIILQPKSSDAIRM